jgi:hypothetical protein
LAGGQVMPLDLRRMLGLGVMTIAILLLTYQK